MPSVNDSNKDRLSANEEKQAEKETVNTAAANEEEKADTQETPLPPLQLLLNLFTGTSPPNPDDIGRIKNCISATITQPTPEVKGTQPTS